MFRGCSRTLKTPNSPPLSEEVAKAKAGGDMPEKTRAASRMPPTGQQDVGYCEGHLIEGARGPFLATKEIAMRCVQSPAVATQHLRPAGLGHVKPTTASAWPVLPALPCGEQSKHHVTRTCEARPRD